MSKELLQKVIDKGVEGYLNEFFLEVSKYYTEMEDDLSEYDGNGFSGFHAIGEINFSPEKLVVVTVNIAGDLTERSGKKAQYEKARKILKKYMRYDAGIFVFSDPSDNFRLSLVYGTPDVTRLVWSNFRRFTYFVSRDQTNNTFRNRVGGCSFSSLDTIKDAFSVEKVNKEFYQKIAEYYYRLTGKNNNPPELKFPSEGEKKSKSDYEEFAVRLIGRTIFCWFLKHKKSERGGAPLIPSEVLSLDAVNNNPDYYHSVLEPLFFEVMNKEPIARKQLKLPKADSIPFLNGGLFERHPNDFYNGMPAYSLKLDNKWFVDFFTILEQYNFTIDENSSIDAEVSVDPEMLGRVFENLLAEVVPETGETARKATGSYYTPRVIVDYMVEQSLKQYLLTKTTLDEGKVGCLLAYGEDIDDFTPSDKLAVVKALTEIKIIDPACGSGAFPMGILHRMLLVLEKVDPKLEIWRRQYLSTLDSIVRQTVEKNVKRENWVYIRKLMIIRDSIYGVDIQPIAVEIAKLRCFLSLVVDELVLDNEENRGIEPLPNLEFKFVAANTLLGLPARVERQGTLGISEHIKTLKKLRDEYLRSSGKDKIEIERKFRQTQKKLLEENAWLLPDGEAKWLAEWDPFSYESCGWFDPEWMFGITGGFDVAIANPPYILLQSVDIDSSVLREIKRQFASAQYKIDTYQLFIELAIRLMASNGILAYITPNTFLKNKYSKKLRKILVDNTLIHDIVLFFTKVFEASSVDNLVIICRKAMSCEYSNHSIKIHEVRTSDFSSEIQKSKLFVQAHITPEDYLFELDVSEDTETIIRILGTGSVEFGEIGRAYFGIQTFDRTKFVSKYRRTSFFKPAIDGANVWRYRLVPASEFVDFKTQAIKSGGNPEVYEKTRIVVRQIGEYPFGTICSAGLYTLNTIYNLYLEKPGYDIRYILAILNSFVIKFFWSVKFYDKKATFPKIKKKPLESIPIKVVSENNQKPLISLVDGILSITKDEDYLANPAKQAKVRELERQIDQMVYELYGLTPEEIAVVEGKAK